MFYEDHISRSRARNVICRSFSSYYRGSAVLTSRLPEAKQGFVVLVRWHRAGEISGAPKLLGAETCLIWTLSTSRIIGSSGFQPIACFRS